MRYCALAVAAMTIWGTSPAFSQEDQPGNFSCMSIADFANASADTSDIRINNFSVRETEPFLANGASAVEFSYAVANRTEMPIAISTDFVLFGADELLLAAASVSPSLGGVLPGRTESAAGHTLADAGTLAEAQRICLRVYKWAR